VEIYQNCIVFNAGAFEDVENRSTRDDFSLKLMHGKPLIFGKAKDRGIRMNGASPEVVNFKPGEPPKDLIIHNEKAGAEYAYLLTQLEPPEFPVPLGVFRAVEEATYEELMEGQIQSSMKPGADDLGKLLCGPETWEVK
jgi:2-oxoglutarate ferredoxin oxidoreductase subunit beta